LFPLLLGGSDDKYKPILPEPNQENTKYQEIQPLLDTPPDLLSVFKDRGEDIAPINSNGSVSAIALIREIQDRYPDFNIVYGTDNITPQGSNVGIKQVEIGEIAIAISSRPLTEIEKRDGLQEVAIAKDAIAVIVHKDNPINNLSIEQLKQIYTCRVTDWITLGWQNANNDPEPFSIEVINRSSESGTQEIFQDRVLGGEAFCIDDSDSNEKNFKTWEKDETTPVVRNLSKYGIYYASLNHVIGAKGVKIIAINQINPADQNGAYILNGDYDLSRNLYAVSKKEAYTNVIEFINFLLSPSGQQIIYKYHVPIYPYNPE
jgi:phosphate transport system substrate-binding protein